jgi:hypothetical protein
MKIPIILVLFLLIIIKSETWYGAVTGADTNDGKNGYAGSRGKALTHFYLCGNRRYRVHYRGFPRDRWSGEFSDCDPVGFGLSIDGIAISGGKGYRVRLKNGDWLPMVYGYNIYDHNNGMAGKLGREIDAILVTGGDSYRFGYGPSTSHIENVASKISQNLFGVTKDFNFENNLGILENNKVMVFGKLVHKIDAELQEGIIKLTINENNVVKADWQGLLPEKVNNFLNQIIDVYNIRTSFESKFSAGLVNGDVTVKIFWLEKKIEINVGSKITKDHWTYRGGVKYTIIMKDDHDDYQKFAKRYKVNNLHDFSWQKIKDFLDNFKNVNSVSNNIIGGIISTFVFVAFQGAFQGVLFA